MKLNDSFLNPLRENIKQMGAVWRRFDLSVKFESTQIDKELDRGISITAEEIEFNDKILTYSGRQVLLYIPDQSKSLETVVRHPEEGTRFHVADCTTLQRMREQKRYDRYVVTNNLTGLFDVTGLDSLGREKKGKASLKICKHCLTALNYKGFALNKDIRIFHNFSLEEFFKDYSTYFKYHPKHTELYGSAYSEDWEEVSYRYKKSKGYKCESCGIDLNAHKRMLATHHINGVKSDNSENNLEALCIDCHRKQAFHSHLFVSREDMLTIYRLRFEQHKSSVTRWTDVYRFVDKALYGVVNYLKSRNYPLPQVGYPIDENTHVDLAWENTHKAVNVDALQVNGWVIDRPHEILASHHTPVRKKPTLEQPSLEFVDNTFNPPTIRQEQRTQIEKKTWQETFLEELCKEEKAYEDCLQKFSKHIPNDIDTLVSPNLICHIYSVLEGKVFGCGFNNIVQSANTIMHDYCEDAEIFLKILDHYSDKKAHLYKMDHKGSFRNKERNFYVNTPEQAREHQAFLSLLFYPSQHQ